MELPAVVAGY